MNDRGKTEICIVLWRIVQCTRKTLVSTTIVSSHRLWIINAAEAAAISSMGVLMYAVKAADLHRPMNESLKPAFAAVAGCGTDSETMAWKIGNVNSY